MVLRENTKGVIVEGSPLKETLLVETATGVHGGLLVKCDSSDTAIELADATDIAIGWCGYEESPAGAQPADIDTAYTADDHAAVHYGGGFVIMAELALGFSVAKGDTLIGWTDGQVAGPWSDTLGLGIPFTTATDTVSDTGVDLPDELLITDACIDVTAIDATETLDVGFLNAGESGDENGLLALISLATAGITVPSATVSGATHSYYASTTYGVLLADFQAGTHADTDEGVHNRISYETDGTIKSVTYTSSAGGDTGTGVIWLKIAHKNLQKVGRAMDTIDAVSAADRVMTLSYL